MLPMDPRFYKALLDRVSDGVYFVNMERRILSWNEGAYRLTGYKADEVVGQCCPDGILCHVDDAGHGLCSVMVALWRQVSPTEDRTRNRSSYLTA